MNAAKPINKLLHKVLKY